MDRPPLWRDSVRVSGPRGRTWVTSPPATTIGGPVVGPNHQPPWSSMASARPTSVRPADPARPIHPDHPPDGRAGGRVVGGQWRPTGRGMPSRAASQAPRRSDRSTRRPAASSTQAAPGGAAVDVAPHPDDHRAAGRLGQDAGQLAVPDQQVVGPLRSGVNPATCRQARRAASPAAAVSRCQRTTRQVARAAAGPTPAGRARLGLPGPVQPAPARGLQVGGHHQTLGGTGRGPGGDHPVGGVDDVEQLDVGEAGRGGQLAPDSLGE